LEKLIYILVAGGGRVASLGGRGGFSKASVGEIEEGGEEGGG